MNEEPGRLSKAKRAYDIFILTLALVSVANVILGLCRVVTFKGTIFGLIDWIILFVFMADYAVRFIMAKKKWAFVKSNVFDLLSIIPYTLFFSFFRIFRLFRVFAIFGRLHSRMRGFLKTNGFGYILFIAFSTIIAGALLLFLAERGVTVSSFGDAIWWAFVTATTVGYGDIVPVTTAGRIVAVVLMIVGISFIGMLTGTIVTWFNGRQSAAVKGKEAADEELCRIALQISALTPAQRSAIASLIESIKDGGK